MKILIAEDDPTSQVLMEGFLKPYGQCRVVGDGKQAVDAFRQAVETGDHYSLVCLDIMMPEMDGYDVLTEIRRLEETAGLTAAQSTKVIMISAVSGMQHIAQAFEQQCEVYIVKPVMRDMLKGALKDLALID